MKHVLTFMVLAGVLFAGCDALTNPGGSEEGSSIPSAVVGTWNATAYILINKADTTQTYDRIQQGGGTLVVTISAEGNYTFTSNFGQGDVVETGTITFSGNQIIVASSGGGTSDTSIYSLSGTTLTVFIEDEEHDFNGDSTPDPARARIVFEKDLTAPPPGGDVPSEVVGTWDAVQYLLTNKADTTQKVDLIQFGVSLTVTIDASGNYTTSFNDGQSTETETGTMTFSGNRVILTPTAGGSPDTSTYSVSGDVLVVFIADEEYDFNGDTTPDPATGQIVFNKDTTPGGGGTVPTEFVGTWNATEYLFINNADTTQKVDFVQDGFSFVLQIDAGGNYTLTTSFDTFQETETGTLSVSGDQVTITPNDGSGSDTIGYTLSGNTLVLTIPDDEFDFDEDGTPESATIRLTFQKS